MSLPWSWCVVSALLASPAISDYQAASCSYCPPPAPPPAPVDCEWSSWSWSACSVSCGRGRQEASRHVTRYTQHGGRPCGSVTRATRDCQEETCPTDCVWGHWSHWACSGTTRSSTVTSEKIIIFITTISGKMTG